MVADPLDHCPSCGEFVDHLLETTGWCANCSQLVHTFICLRCDNEFKSKTKRPYCWTCRELNWLDKHADEIEDYMIQGCTFAAAKEKARDNNKPICLGCGDVLPKIGLFCQSKPRCRKLRSRFFRLRSKGISEEQALREIFET